MYDGRWRVSETIGRYLIYMEDGAFCNDDTKGNARLAPKFAGFRGARRKKDKKARNMMKGF